MKSLTKAEEQVMKVLWKSGSGMLSDIVNSMPAPKPHQNTVATVLKILVEKEFVKVEVLGRSHRYHALISKEKYSGNTLVNVAKGYFEGSFASLVSFMVDKKQLSVDELETLLKELKKQKKH